MQNLFSFLLCNFLLIAMVHSASFAPITKSRLHSVHQAVFNSFVPFEKSEVDTTINSLVEETRHAHFNVARSVPKIRQALFLLDHLHLLSSKPFLRAYYRLLAHDRPSARKVTTASLLKIKRFLHEINKSKMLSITELSIEERQRLFSILIRSPINVLRQVGFYTRLFFNQAIYEGALGEKISNRVDKGYVEAEIVPSLPLFSTHLTYHEKKKSLFGELDAIVIGSGPAGSVAAHELQKKGLKVLVIEAGPMIIPGSHNTISDPRFMENGMPRISENGSIALLNGESVGGGSTVNLDMSFSPTLPMVRHRFHQWHKDGLIPKKLWTDEEIDAASAWVESIFSPRLVEWDEINANNEILRRGANILGIPHQLYRLNSYKKNASPFQVYRKKSSFEKLLLPAMEGENAVTLLSDCRVEKVIIEKGIASGVECVYEPKQRRFGIVRDLYGFKIKRKTKITAFAKHVILAAGNLGTSVVLLKSGIANENIGRGFVVHPFIPLMGIFDDSIRAEDGEPSTVYIDHFMPTDISLKQPGFLLEPGLGRMSLWALLTPGSPRQMKENFSKLDKLGGFSAMLIDTPHKDNRIELSRTGRIKVHYTLSDSDRSRFILAVKTSAKILFAAGAREVSFNSFEEPLFQKSDLESNTLTPDMDLDHVMKNFAISESQTSLLAAHMMGGNKIGTSAENSVVNSDYKVWGFNNLYVIDSSLFPTSVGANPMQTIYTVAKIFTERFLRSYGGS